MTLFRITNTTQRYAWGRPDGISRALGQQPTGSPEAELWLGAHPIAPSRSADPDVAWPDLLAWEQRTGTELPYLLKLLAASSPLSLQAHPTPEQAREGFAREESAGIPRDDFARSYKDPHAKPELIVAVEDGFDALCGFRLVTETLDDIDVLADLAPATQWAIWRDLLAGADGVRAAFAWLLSGDAEVVALVEALTQAARREPERFALLALLTEHYPGDPGTAVALMLNHVTLRVGEALWLPAGNVHAYLSGLGVELMGPSDNVLRGGLTPKHIDKQELQRVLDFSAGEPSRLEPIALAAHALAYRPASVESGANVPFELVSATGDTTLQTGLAAIGLVLDGTFSVADAEGSSLACKRGDAFFAENPSTITVVGTGLLVLAHAR